MDKIIIDKKDSRSLTIGAAVNVVWHGVVTNDSWQHLFSLSESFQTHGWFIESNSLSHWPLLAATQNEDSDGWFERTGSDGIGDGMSDGISFCVSKILGCDDG